MQAVVTPHRADYLNHPRCCLPSGSLHRQGMTSMPAPQRYLCPHHSTHIHPRHSLGDKVQIPSQSKGPSDFLLTFLSPTLHRGPFYLGGHSVFCPCVLEAKALGYRAKQVNKTSRMGRMNRICGKREQPCRGPELAVAVGQESR